MLLDLGIFFVFSIEDNLVKKEFNFDFDNKDYLVYFIFFKSKLFKIKVEFLFVICLLMILIVIFFLFFMLSVIFVIIVVVVVNLVMSGNLVLLFKEEFMMECLVEEVED